MAFTFFFRDLKPLEHAAGFLKVHAAGRSRVLIWDAGCATGHEPYTLAMVLAETMGPFAFRNVQIVATDYDPPLLQILTEAIYPADELQRLPAGYLAKYFEPVSEGRRYRVREEIRRRVSPCRHDLLTLNPVQSGFSMIICKNVLLHFGHEQRIEVLRMFHGALEPGGILAMEHTQKMPANLSGHYQQLVNDGQVFSKKESQP